MAKSQKNIRISKHTKSQLAEICDIWGETQTNVIAAAIGELYRKVRIKMHTNDQQDEIMLRLNADEWQQVEDLYTGMTARQIRASLDGMFPKEDNSDLAKMIFESVHIQNE